MEQFIKAGFKKEKDPMFQFRKELVTPEEIEQNGLEEDYVPCLLYGNTSAGGGFCVYTGEHFIWLNVETPQAAVEFANKIVSFEPV